MKRIIYTTCFLCLQFVLHAQFPVSPLNWSTPIGGLVSDGYTLTDYSATQSDYGSQSWNLIDMNGDGKPDLVVTNLVDSIGNGPEYGLNTIPNWHVYLSNGHGFSANFTSWVTPAGGAHNLGFNQTSYIAGSFEAGTESWYLVDMNGDGKPDLVVTDSVDASQNVLEFGISSSPYWKVYLNTGSGFATTPVNWSTPTGGVASQGYIETSYTADPTEVGSQTWSLVDMNGDGKPDLLLTDSINAQQAALQYGVGQVGVGQYWKVFLNTGTGFAANSVNWPTPDGGISAEGYIWNIYIAATTDVGSESWSLADMDGDGKPDLVVTDSVSASQIQTQFGVGQPGVGQYWKVYINNGTGFSTTPVHWNTATGGVAGGGFIETTYAASGAEVGNQSWDLRDLDGDGKPDLVVTDSVNVSQSPVQFGVGQPGIGQYWKVYLNTGNGFASGAVTWTTPTGGLPAEGYILTSFSSDGFEVAGQSWEVIDMNGDGKPDLVVTDSVNAAQVPVQFGAGPGVAGIWRVYLNANQPSAISDPLQSDAGCILYPNPGNGNFTLQFNDAAERDVEVYDALGRQVVSPVRMQQQQQFNLGNVSAGIYVLRIIQNGAAKTLKLVVQ